MGTQSSFLDNEFNKTNIDIKLNVNKLKNIINNINELSLKNIKINLLDYFFIIYDYNNDNKYLRISDY